MPRVKSSEPSRACEMILIHRYKEVTAEKPTPYIRWVALIAFKHEVWPDVSRKSNFSAAELLFDPVATSIDQQNPGAIK